MRRRARGVAHVVQAVEEGYEVEILLRIFLGSRDLEAGVCRCAMLPGMRRGLLDRVRVEVVADELRVGEGLRHQDGGPTMAAPDIGDFRALLPFFDYAVERGKPIAHQVVVVAGE